jgi:hypothetical protein
MSEKRAMELWDDEDGFVITVDGQVITDIDEILEIEKDNEITEEEYQASQRAAERLLNLGKEITPVRVFAASAIIVLLIGSIFASWYWVIPRDSVDVESKYFQRGGGHVVLVELNNLGTRTIRDITVVVIFEDSEGYTLAETSWHKGEMPAHSSYSGDDLELLVRGYTVWAEYNIVLSVSWQDDSGRHHSETFTHTVGEWTSERFTDEAGRNWILF